MDSKYANWIISRMHKISYDLEEEEEEVDSISAVKSINILKAGEVIEATVLAKFNSMSTTSREKSNMMRATRRARMIV